MHKKLCIIHANCQGEELERLLMASGDFSGTFRLLRHTNYIKEPIPAEALADCAVFLYQSLGPEWGELASESLLARLSSSAAALQIPNMLFKGCWPFWTSKSPIDFGDSLLNRLLQEGAPKEAILRIYLHRDITAFIDLDAAFRQSIAIEKNKETGACVKTVDFVLEHWRDRALFHTVNHPGRELLVRTAQGILQNLGCAPLGAGELARVFQDKRFPSYADFDLPIHPQVAAFHGLKFIKPDQEFAVFGRRMTFPQYISRYIDCCRNGMEENFLAYLQLV